MQMILDLIKLIDQTATQEQDKVFIINIDQRFVKTVLLLLKNNPQLRFEILTDLFAADFPTRAQRFEVVYNLLSLELNLRLMLKVNVPIFPYRISLYADLYLSSTLLALEYPKQFSLAKRPASRSLW